MKQISQWKSHYLAAIGSNPVRAGIPNAAPDWEQLIPSGNAGGSLVDDSAYYHNGGARQVAFRLADGAKLWDVESAARESSGSDAMILGDLLVRAAPTLVRDKKTGALVADLKASLGCPEDTFGFGSFSFCYEWNGNVLFLLQRPNYQCRLVDATDFSELEWELGPGYIMKDEGDRIVFSSGAQPDFIEIYNKPQHTVITRIQDPYFDLSRDQPKFALHGDVLSVGTNKGGVFKAWDTNSGELLWESPCPLAVSDAPDEESVDTQLEGVIAVEDGFLVFRHFTIGKRSLTNEIWHLDAQDGHARKCAEFGSERITRSGTKAGSVFFLHCRNNDGSFSPCAIDSYTGELIWQAEHQSKHGYEILVSDQYVVYVESNPDPCKVLCYSWAREYSDGV